jgi:predicted hotdog family 3-hydroxylacyl-ACP dehydratase
MCFIAALTHADTDCARATANFPADHFAVSNGLVTEAALVECVAQTFAAALGHSAGSGQKPALGMLAAVTDFQIHTRPAAGALLEIEVRERKRLGPLRLVAGTITSAGQLIAAGELTVYA